MKKLLAVIVSGAVAVLVLYALDPAPAAAAPSSTEQWGGLLGLRRNVAVPPVLVASISPAMLIEPVVYEATTTTYAGNGRVAIAASNSGTESAPSVATDGLSLVGVGSVVVTLKTASAATAGGTLQAYVYSPDAGAWGRVPDLDLTAIAATSQSWPAIYVPVSRGRVMWVPTGIGGGATTTVYIVGQSK